MKSVPPAWAGGFIGQAWTWVLDPPANAGGADLNSRVDRSVLTL